MKVIVDIPDNVYSVLSWKDINLSEQQVTEGLPVATLLSQIRSDLDEIRRNSLKHLKWEYGQGLDTAIKIVDNYVKKYVKEV